MSYDLAVWEGERPADDRAAGRAFTDLYDRYVDTWSTGPLIGEACGPLIYFPMRWSMAEEASTCAAALAHSMGRVCFDPQENRLRP
jgi:hypothetical protein